MQGVGEGDESGFYYVIKKHEDIMNAQKVGGKLIASVFLSARTVAL